MPAPLRKSDSKTQKLLQAEFERLSRQERTPNELMIERFLQCPEAQKCSKITASLVGRQRYVDRPIPTPSALLPWLQ